MLANLTLPNANRSSLLLLLMVILLGALVCAHLSIHPAHAQPAFTERDNADCEQLREIFERSASASSQDERQFTDHLVDQLCEHHDLVLAEECQAGDHSAWPSHRAVMARDLAMIMSDPQILDSLNSNTLEIRCAKIIGPLDLSAEAVADRFVFKSVVFSDPVLLSHSRFDFPLEFEDAIFEKEFRGGHMEVSGDLLFQSSVFKDLVQLSDSVISGNVSANDTIFQGRYLFANADVGGGFFVSDGSVFQKNLTMLKAVIDDDFSGLGSTFCGEINAYAAHVGGDFILGKNHETSAPTQVTKLILRNATIERDLKMGFLYLGRRIPPKDQGIEEEHGNYRSLSSFDRCEEKGVEDDHFFERMTVRGDVDLSRGKFMGTMNFMAAKIDGSFYAELAMFSQDLWLENIGIDGSFRVNGARFDDNLILRGATILKDAELWRGRVDNLSAQGAHFGSNLDVRGRLFSSSLNLNGGVVVGDLIIGTFENGRTLNAIWGHNAKLLARNLEVRGIQDTQSLWEEPSAPERLDLVGFTYSQFAGGSGSTDTPIPARESDWFRVHWFEKQIDQSDGVAAGLYGQLVDALRGNGFQEKANAVLVDFYDGVGPQQKGWTNQASYFFSAFLDYGNAPGKGLLLFLVPLAIGVGLVIFIEKPKTSQGNWTAGDNLFFTVDALLPAVSLQKTYDDYVFRTRVKYYFYFLKFSGYIFLFLFIRWINGVYTYFPLFRN